jgi:fused signal recognition particle receptor
MFKFLKDKLSDAIKHFTKEVSEEVEEPLKETEVLAKKTDVEEDREIVVKKAEEDIDKASDKKAEENVKNKSEDKPEEQDTGEDKTKIKCSDKIIDEKAEKEDYIKSDVSKTNDDFEQINDEATESDKSKTRLTEISINKNKAHGEDEKAEVDLYSNKKKEDSQVEEEIKDIQDKKSEEDKDLIHEQIIKTQQTQTDMLPTESVQKEVSEDLSVESDKIEATDLNQSGLSDDIELESSGEQEIGQELKKESFFDRFKGVFTKSKKTGHGLSEEHKKEPVKQEELSEKTFFSKIGDRLTKRKLSAGKFEEMFFNLELVLLENNVAIEVIEKIKEDLSKAIVDVALPRNKINEVIVHTLRDSIEGLFHETDIDIIKIVKEKKDKPVKILFVGVNGSGKTTSIAKIAHYLKSSGISTVISASDTFRAASIEQLQMHADRIGVKLIKHDYGSDAAAVAFDAINYAKSKNIDVVLIDTAGRLHSNSNLMDELKKVNRVSNPDLKIFVGESITGNDCVEQSTKFDDAVSIDGIILSKADVDEKGGTAISVSYVTKKPIYFLGVGQEYGDLEPFNKDKLMKSLGLR